MGIDENQRFCLALADILGEIYGEEGIIAKNNEGINVICDRFYISTEVYQSDVDDDILQAGRKSVYRDLNSVVVFFLDVTLNNSRIRREKRGTTELYEDDYILHRTNEKYSKVLETYNNVTKYVLDGNQSISEIAENIYKIGIRELNKKQYIDKIF